MHMAIGAVINAAWDLAARAANKPLWRFIAELTPEQLVDTIDFRYLSDALTRDEALALLRDAQPQRAARIATLIEQGSPAYTTSPGWLGYSDEKLVRLAKEAVADGFRTIKLKVGANVQDDIRRCRLARAAGGVPVAAHPRAASRQRRLVPDETFAQMAEAGLAALEMNHRDQDPEQREQVRLLAQRLGLGLSGASDYHGTGKPNRLGENLMPPELLEQILDEGTLDLVRP